MCVPSITLQISFIMLLTVTWSIKLHSGSCLKIRFVHGMGQETSASMTCNCIYNYSYRPIRLQNSLLLKHLCKLAIYLARNVIENHWQRRQSGHCCLTAAQRQGCSAMKAKQTDAVTGITSDHNNYFCSADWTWGRFAAGIEQAKNRYRMG